MPKSNNKKQCPHCYPAPGAGHFFDRIEYILKKFFVFDVFDIKFNGVMVLKLLQLLKMFKLLSFDGKPDKTKIKNRSYIFFEEAQNRGMPIWAIKFLNNYIGEYIFQYKGQMYRYSGTPLSLFPRRKLDVDDKMRIKKLLSVHGLPVAKGKSFWKAEKAYDYGMKLGFGLVVKPNSGSLSRHVKCNIQSWEELEKSIQVALEYQPEIIVEKYIQGSLYRATIIDQKIIYVCQKKLASIEGDGVSTVMSLIEKKNILEKRGSAMDTLQKVIIDDQLIKILNQNKMNLDTVLLQEERIYISNKYTLGGSCEIENVKEKVHPENMKMFLKAAAILGQPLIGLDFICPDISKSYLEQECAIIEANSFPYLDMHQYSSLGASEPVASDVWNEVLAKLGCR